MLQYSQENICVGYCFISPESVRKLLNRKGTFNPFVPNASFLYPVKISEKRKVFCTYVVPRLELRTFGYRMQIANH